MGFQSNFHVDDSVEMFKAMLVAKCYNQVEGLNYFDTYSPMVRLITVRLVIALIFINKWFIYQLDANNVFLYCELQEDVCMAIALTSNPPNITKCVKSRIHCMA